MKGVDFLFQQYFSSCQQVGKVMCLEGNYTDTFGKMNSPE